MSEKEIDFRMTKARTALIQRHPFWGTLALYLQLIEDPAVGTMATDGVKLVFAPQFLDSITERQIEAVVAHEVSHCAYRHMTRIGSRDHELWNAACDYAINRDLIAAKFDLPKPHLYEKRFDGLSAEEIYAILLQECANQPDKKQGMFKVSQGCGEVMKAPTDSESEIADLQTEWDIRLRQAIATEKARHAGNLPDFLQRMFNIANKPTVDWRAVLRNFWDASARFDYSWRKPHRGLLSMGITIPGAVPDGVRQLVVILDTSGSVYFHKGMMEKFLAELQGLMDESACERMTFICADHDIKKPQEFVFGDKIDPKIIGGGGTSFAPAIEWVMKNEPDAASIIYFTDLEVYGEGWGRDPGIPTLWVTYGPADEVLPKMAHVPYGDVVHMLD